MDILQRVKNTPKCDWPVADHELSGAGKFFGLYGGEHIAATEFVIGATLVQYGCSATDILIGLAIGNLLATLCFAWLCAPLATQTRLSLYTYLQRVVGKRVQKLYNLVFGIGFAALGATGICISASAIRRILNIPIQHEWYPTSIKFVFVVLVLGAVIIFIAANGFEGVSRFASACVPWMITLFGLGFICVLPQLAQATGSGAVRSPMDVFRLLDTQVWAAQAPAGGLYTQEEQEEMEYEQALQDYVNQQRPEVEHTETPAAVKCLKYIGYAALAGMLVTGILFWAGPVAASLMKTIEFVCTIIYFASILLATVFTLKKDA